MPRKPSMDTIDRSERSKALKLKIGGFKMFYLDMVTKYYDKRDPSKERKYYNAPDELFTAKGRFEYVGKYIIPSWMGIKNVEIVKEG